jgi:hypothetical protein
VATAARARSPYAGERMLWAHSSGVRDDPRSDLPKRVV